MATCPACGSTMPVNTVVCPCCGGSYLPDGSFREPWADEMARMVAEREKKVERAQRFGAWGKPIPHFFLENKSGCLVAILLLAALATGAVAGAVII